MLSAPLCLSNEELGAARMATDALRRRLRELNPGDRGFFRDALRCLPELG